MSTEVGSAYVAIIPSARGFAKQLQKDIAKEFAGSKLDALISDALAGTSVTVPVRPKISDDIPDELPVRPGREPVLPVRLDPLTDALQADVRRELAGLTRDAVAIDVGADTDGLRTEVSAAIAAVEATLSAQVPTEPGDRREYERRLREQVAEVSSRVRASVTADVDVDVDTPLRDGRVEAAGDTVGRTLAAGILSSLTSGLGLISGPVLFGGLIAAAVATAPLVGAALAGGILAAVGGGVIGLGILGVRDDPRFKAKATELGTTLKETLAKAAGPLLGTEQAPGPLLRAMDTLKQLVIDIGPSLEQMFAAIGPYIPGLAEGFAAFVKEVMPGLLKAVEASGPLLEVIALNVGPLGEQVGDFLAVVASLGPAAGDALNVIFFLLELGITTVTGFLYILGAAFGGLFDLAQKAKDRIGEMIDFITGVFEAGRNAVKGKAEALAGSVLRTFREIFDNLTGGSKRALDSVTSAFGGVPGRIKNAIGNLGGLLFDAGRNVVQGLVDGLKSMFGFLGDTAGSMAGIIRNYLPFSPAKEGPLSGRGNPFYSGRSIVELLAGGVTSNLSAARSAAGDLADAFALSGSPLTAAPAGAGYGAAAALAPAAAQIEFVGDAPDSFVRWVRQNTRIYYGGDPNAAFGS